MGHPKLSTGSFFDPFTKGWGILIIEMLHQESVHRCSLGCNLTHLGGST